MTAAEKLLGGWQQGPRAWYLMAAGVGVPSGITVWHTASSFRNSRIEPGSASLCHAHPISRLRSPVTHASSAHCLSFVPLKSETPVHAAAWRDSCMYAQPPSRRALIMPCVIQFQLGKWQDGVHGSSKLKPSSRTAPSERGSSTRTCPARAAMVRSISVTPRPYLTPAIEHLKNSILLHVSVPACGFHVP